MTNLKNDSNHIIQQYKPDFGEEEGEALKNLVNTGSWLSDYKKTQEFEDKISELTGVRYCHAVNNGTIALSIALKVGGIRPLDWVLVPNMTMIATAFSAEFIGCNIILCPVNELGLITYDYVKEVYRDLMIHGQKIKAVIYVSLNGRNEEKEIKKLYNFCKSYEILFIKDDAQAFLSRTKSDKCLQNSEYADIHTLSFSPHKLISTGQGGALLTDNKVFDEAIARYKDFGRTSGGEDIHDYYGTNAKFTEMQAVVGLYQLTKVKERIKFKIDLYNYYYMYIVMGYGKHCFMHRINDYEVPWFVDIYFLSEEIRDKVQKDLLKVDIQTRKIYPALNTQTVYKWQDKYKKDCSEKIAKNGLFMPSSFDLEKGTVEYICRNIGDSSEGII